MTKLTNRITIRLSKAEYDVIDAFCVEHDINFSELFMESVREMIPGLPPRTYVYGGRDMHARQEAFQETLMFYQKRL